MNLAGEHADCVRIADAAGRLLLDLRRALDDPSVDAKRVRDLGDRRSHELIMAELASAYPGDGILSEEGTDNSERLGRARTWIVDPLDGTREFGEAGRTDWAVHIALTVDSRPVAGAVALPGRGITLATDPRPPSPPAPAGAPRVVVSRTRPPALALAVTERLGGSLIEMGSAGAKMMAVVLGEADVYLHGGGQWEWDSCAPVAVATAAGLHASRLDGSELRYNQEHPWLPDIVICHPEIAARVLLAIHQCS